MDVLPKGAREQYAKEWQFRYDRANALCAVGRYQDAIFEYRKCIELNPSFAWAFGNLSVALTTVGRLQEALAAVDAALALLPNDADFAANRREIILGIQNSSVRRPTLARILLALLLGVAAFFAATRVMQCGHVGSVERERRTATSVHS